MKKIAEMTKITLQRVILDFLENDITDYFKTSPTI